MRGGYSLVLVLFLTLLFLILGLGFLESRSSQYQVAQGLISGLQAQALAEAGIADARAKLGRDWDFPPLGRRQQPEYTYGEEVAGSDGKLAGSFQVTVSRKWLQPPYSLIKLVSVGMARSRPDEKPLALHRIEAVVDMSWQVRGQPASLTVDPTNPGYFRLMNWQSQAAP
ncbi:MAG: hypothetical protein U0931_20955 [Vulcanimicrobiota bacterium]